MHLAGPEEDVIKAARQHIFTNLTKVNTATVSITHSTQVNSGNSAKLKPLENKSHDKSTEITQVTCGKVQPQSSRGSGLVECANSCPIAPTSIPVGENTIAPTSPKPKRKREHKMPHKDQKDEDKPKRPRK